jgi:phosphodiesterase/alkaline phosphatase D-like protein
LDFWTLFTGPPEKPINFYFETVTAKSVTLFWTSEQNGGYPQTFSIESHAKGENQFTLIAENIADPGLGETVVYMAVDLNPHTTYQFRVSAKNTHNGGSSTLGDVITVTTLGKLLIIFIF